MDYKTKEELFDDFKKEEVDYITAIEILTNQFNMIPKEAEALVDAWES